MVNWEKEKSNIEKLIQQGVSYERIGREYHCTGNNIKKVARKLGIPLESRRIVNEKETFNKGCGNVKKCKHCGKPLLKRNCIFCSAECKNQYKQKELVELWKKGEIDGHMADGSTRTFVRRYLYEKNEYKCQKCGFDKKNEYTNLPILQVHHIDGDCYNSKEENLQLLCPNCHCLTENFGSRNTQSTRRDKRTKYYKELVEKQLISSTGVSD